MVKVMDIRYQGSNLFVYDGGIISKIDNLVNKNNHIIIPDIAVAFNAD